MEYGIIDIMRSFHRSKDPLNAGLTSGREGSISEEQKHQRPRSETTLARRAPVKIVRVRVFHKATFRRLLLDALQASACFRYRGQYWTPLHKGREFTVYCRAPDFLACVQERVEDYQVRFFQSLLQGQYGRDGILRPRTHLWRQSDGTYRASIGAGGERS